MAEKEYIIQEALTEFRNEVVDEFIDLCWGNDYNKVNLLKIGDTIDQIYDKHIERHSEADVVEVVRCKDCKYWKQVTAERHACCMIGFEMDYDEYCSYGERKE